MQQNVWLRLAVSWEARMNLHEFLRAFYPDENEAICFRAFRPKDAPDAEMNRPVKVSLTQKQLTAAEGELALQKLNHLRGLYFIPNAGGHTDADITRFNAVFVENDNLPIAAQLAALDSCPLPTSIRVTTKKSVHAYWLLKENCSIEEWKNVQLQLIQYFDGDKAIKNPSRLMRLPGFMHLTYNPAAAGGYDHKFVEVVQFNPERRYAIDEIGKGFPQFESPSLSSPLNGAEIIGNGNRNNALFSLAGSLRNRGLGENEIVATLAEVNRTRVRPPLQDNELSEIARNVMRYAPDAPIARRDNNFGNDEPFESLAFPRLPEAALYGVAGDVVRVIEPHTEADSAALLVQLLAGFGCLIGKIPYFRTEADLHYTKIFCVIVGASSKGRKGTSWGYIRRLLLRVEESFLNCIQDGLSSGEGLIFHVRDEQIKKSPIKVKGRIVEYQDEIVDEGAKEKRAFVLEPEFARVLRVMQREGNTLSSVIRQAWDTDRLRVMTKTPLIATETHISIVGHITTVEVRRNLDETEMANGFANRFLWVLSRRSKLLPFGGNLDEADLNPLVMRLHNALVHARSTSEIKRDADADVYWSQIYGELSKGHPGLLGSVTSRAEAQVMRLACLYALLDCSLWIRRQHLEAAAAFWKYCLDSARYIFGNQTGDKTADKIYAALQGAEDGLSRTQLRDLFQRNATAGQINSGLKVLIELGRIDVQTQKTDGRTAEVFRVVGYDKNDQSPNLI